MNLERNKPKEGIKRQELQQLQDDRIRGQKHYRGHRARMVERPDDWKWSSYLATAGRGLPHSSLTTDWVLGQFSGKRGKAEQEYRQFVRWGIGEPSIWIEVRGQALLGEEGFVDQHGEQLRKQKDVPEITRSQRFLNRPSLEKLLGERTNRNKTKRNKAISEAVEKHGYRQREVADHLGMYFTSISRIVRQKR